MSKIKWVETKKRLVPRKIKLVRPIKDVDTAALAIKSIKYRLEWAKTHDTIIAELNKIKLASGCVDCGYRGHPTALQFDHVRGKKIKAVSQFMNLKDALAEAAKCEVRCAVCHSIKTWEWKQELRKERIARDLTLLKEAGT